MTESLSDSIHSSTIGIFSTLDSYFPLQPGLTYNFWFHLLQLLTADEMTNRTCTCCRPVYDQFFSKQRLESFPEFGKEYDHRNFHLNLAEALEESVCSLCSLIYENLVNFKSII